MSQQDAAKQQANTRNNIRVVSIFTAAAIGLVGVLVILYAWQLPPFTRHSQFTDNAYVRGQTTFISPQVNGYITAVNVKDFAIVQPGEVLFQIDDRIYKQRVHQAQATLAMKEAALRNNLQQRKSAEATIAKNEAALQNARAQNLKIQADLKRIQQLTADGSLSIRERDSARASAAQGAADIEQAKAALEMSRQDHESTIVNRDSLEADVASAKAALELAQIDLQNTQIIAPTGGQLGQISVRLGGLCQRRNPSDLAGSAAALGDCQPQRDPVGRSTRWPAGHLHRRRAQRRDLPRQGAEYLPGDRGGVQRHLSGQRHRQFRQDRPAHPGAYYGQRRAKQQRTPAAGDVGAGDY